MISVFSDFPGAEKNGIKPYGKSTRKLNKAQTHQKILHVWAHSFIEEVVAALACPVAFQ